MNPKPAPPTPPLRLEGDTESDTALREQVRSHYAGAARAVRAGAASCCGPAPASISAPAPAQPAERCCSDRPGLGYDAVEIGRLPREAVAASLGCGNPIALAELREGETVLDLGSGGGIDVLLSARRVGPTGFAYGVDMTDEMLELARENQRKAGIENARFLRGTIEEVPLPPYSVDVVISNCVINLSTDKARTLREAYRVLRPGGRLAVADIVTTEPLPPRVREAVALWAGCVAGALPIDEYRATLADAGFEEIMIEPIGDAASLALGDAEAASLRDRLSWDGRVLSAFVRARKPGGARER